MSEKTPEKYRDGPVRAIRDVVIWDSERGEWVPGFNANLKMLPDVVKLKWTNTGVDTDVDPDEDKEIYVERARHIAIQADTTLASNTSTSFDINVEASMDGQKWDSIPYAEMNLGDNEIKTMLINPGPKYIRLRGDQNASAKTGYVEAYVKVIE